MRLELESEELMSEKKHYQLLDPIVKPFAPKGIKIYNKNSIQDKNTKGIINKWIEAHTKHKTKACAKLSAKLTIRNNDRHSILEEDE